MRRIAPTVLVAFYLVGIPILASDTVVYIDTRGDGILASDAAYLNAIHSQKHTEAVRVIRKSDGVRVAVQVEVTSSLTVKELTDLLQPILEGRESLGSKKVRLGVRVEGDKHRVKVSVGSGCGLLCGGGESYMYSADDGAWRYLYTFDHWIS